MAKKNQTISNRTAAATVEYDHGKQRRTKHFDDANEAKSFYAAKDAAGKNPRVIATETEPATEGTKTGKAAQTETKPKETATAKAPGVRAVRSRPYLAGVIIAKHGLAAGVTEAMVAELDAAYGKANPTESQFCLKNAWHACRAYAGIAADAVA